MTVTISAAMEDPKRSIAISNLQIFEGFFFVEQLIASQNGYQGAISVPLAHL